MTDIPKCTSWRGHKFEARFDITPPPMNVSSFEGGALAYKMMIEAHTTKTHVHDICVRCGHIIERAKP